MKTTKISPALRNAQNVGQNALKIGPDYFRVADLKEAVDAWIACRDQNGWGASEAPSVTCCIDRKLYRISYNGRVWDAGTGEEVKVGDRKTAKEQDALGWAEFRLTPVPPTPASLRGISAKTLRAADSVLADKYAGWVDENRETLTRMIVGRLAS